MGENNGWSEHKLLVLEGLKDLKDAIKDIAEKQSEMQTTLIKMQTESKVAKYFGGVALPAGVSVACLWVGKKLGL